MLTVKRISHATFETPDLEKQIDYHVNVLGLSLAERENGRAYLATTTGQQSVVLEKGEAARCTRLAFQVDPASNLGGLAKALSDQHGIRAERRNGAVPGIGETLSFEDPKGTTVEIFAESRMLDKDRTPKGFLPLKLGHLAFKVTDIQEIVRFYSEVLGFRVSDWRQDFFVFMRCGPDHHTVNFATAEKVKMHHVAFELKDQAEMLRACDFLGKNKFKLIWGPGRHVIGDNVFTYHRDPDGHIIELYTELARIDSEELGYFVPRPWRNDRPYGPTVWGPETLGNLWGPPAPPGFGD
jgi:catechol 2,3-dioxygenase-like lactoylglutathione lyase family enzyme